MVCFRVLQYQQFTSKVWHISSITINEAAFQRKKCDKIYVCEALFVKTLAAWLVMFTLLAWTGEWPRQHVSCQMQTKYPGSSLIQIFSKCFLIIISHNMQRDPEEILEEDKYTRQVTFVCG